MSDHGGAIASPEMVIAGADAASADARRILVWAQQNEVSAIVVGMPLNMDGTAGPQAQTTQAFVDQLLKLGDLPVETWDERLSSFQADEWMHAAGLTRARRKKLRDALAAQVILQSFLDARRENPEKKPEE